MTTGMPLALAKELDWMMLAPVVICVALLLLTAPDRRASLLMTSVPPRAFSSVPALAGAGAATGTATGVATVAVTTAAGAGTTTVSAPTAGSGAGVIAGASVPYAAL